MTPERFYRKTEREGECLIWQGQGRINGYGVAGYGGVHWLAHRLSYFFAHGSIPADLQIRHACDTRLCVEPSHLSVGTAKDNANDKVSRNRQRKGETHPMRKLGPGAVREIRERYRRGDVTQKVLAEEFGISKQQMSRIIRGERWVDDPVGSQNKGD